MTVDAAGGFPTAGQVAPSRIRNWYVESGQYTTAEQYGIPAITVLCFALPPDADDAADPFADVEVTITDPPADEDAYR